MSMNEQPVRLGRISRNVEKAVGKDFGADIWVYVRNEELDHLARSWPTSYLTRLEESGRIIKNPDYVAYDEKKKILYFIKEYFHEGIFKKVVLSLQDDIQWHFLDLAVLNEAILSKILSESPLKRVNS